MDADLRLNPICNPMAVPDSRLQVPEALRSRRARPQQHPDDHVRPRGAGLFGWVPLRAQPCALPVGGLGLRGERAVLAGLVAGVCVVLNCFPDT